MSSATAHIFLSILKILVGFSHSVTELKYGIVLSATKMLSKMSQMMKIPIGGEKIKFLYKRSFCAVLDLVLLLI